MSVYGFRMTRRESHMLDRNPLEMTKLLVAHSILPHPRMIFLTFPDPQPGSSISLMTTLVCMKTFITDTGLSFLPTSDKCANNPCFSESWSAG